MRLRPALMTAVVLALLAVTAVVAAGPTVAQGPTVAFSPGRVADGAVTPSTAVAYDGEPLTLQTVYVGADAPEPTIGLDKTGAAFIAANNVVVRSTDGGLSWTDVGARVAGVSTPPTNLDPFVYVDEDTGRVFQPQLYLGCSYMNISDDQGKSWTPNPVACGNYVNDHQSIVAGPPPGNLQTVNYPNVVYYCFNRVIDANCGRSLDGGLTFTPTPTPAFLGYDPAAGGLCGGLHGHIRTDSKGRLFMPKGHCNQPWIAISDDGGNTWERIKVSDATTSFDTHHGLAIDDADNLYYLFMDEERKLPLLSISADHGQTWTEPRMVAPPGVEETNFPILTAGAPGRIALQFPGTTSASRDDARRPWDAYMVVTENALDPEPLFLATTANAPGDPIHRGACGTGSNTGRCAGMLDFLDIDVSPVDGRFWAALTDTCTGGCAKGSGGATARAGVAVRQIGGPVLRPAAASTVEE
jgi:hypothetical protein